MIDMMCGTSFVKVKEPTVATTRHSRVYVVIYFVLLELTHPQTVGDAVKIGN